jgi:hypothetical protein
VRGAGGASSSKEEGSLNAPVPGSGIAAMSSTEASSVPACTASVRSPSVTVPAAMSTPLCCSASAMVCDESPFAARASAEGAIVTRSSRAPESCASRTPSMSLSSGIATRSMSCAASSGVSPSAGATAIWITGKSSMLPDITCVSAASGSSCEMRLIARSTFCSVAVMSTP